MRIGRSARDHRHPPRTIHRGRCTPGDRARSSSTVSTSAAGWTARSPRPPTAGHRRSSSPKRRDRQDPAPAGADGASGLVAGRGSGRREPDPARAGGAVEPPVWADLIDAWDAVPDAFEAMYARYRWAEAELGLTGIKAHVGARLREAHERAVRRSGPSPAGHGSISGPRSRARRWRPASRYPPVGPRARQPGAVGLSARELEVLALIPAGRSNGEIVDER
jgi:hypothetical protein